MGKIRAASRVHLGASAGKGPKTCLLEVAVRENVQKQQRQQACFAYAETG